MAETPPEGPRRTGRRVYGRSYRARLSQAQQYIFVGLALMFLLAWFLFRDSCSRRIGQTFGTVTDRPTADAGAPRPRARPLRPKADPDDW